jgi:Fe-S-cluster containining protein
MSKIKGRREQKDWPCQKCGDCCSIFAMPASFINKYRDRFQTEVLNEYSPQMQTHDPLLTIITKSGTCIFF